MRLEITPSSHTRGDLMFDLSKVYAHCPTCQTKLQWHQSQPYSNRTWRLLIECLNFECEWDGLLIEVEQ
jgi:hypothetical protein